VETNSHLRTQPGILDRTCMNESKQHGVRGNILAGMTGNVLEWYDFAVYGFLAPILG
jgi:hypothetical protein